jgi:hypothetical protein
MTDPLFPLPLELRNLQYPLSVVESNNFEITFLHGPSLHIHVVVKSLLKDVQWAEKQHYWSIYINILTKNAQKLMQGPSVYKWKESTNCSYLFLFFDCLNFLKLKIC